MSICSIFKKIVGLCGAPAGFEPGTESNKIKFQTLADLADVGLNGTDSYSEKQKVIKNIAKMVKKDDKVLAKTLKKSIEASEGLLTHAPESFYQSAEYINTYGFSDRHGDFVNGDKASQYLDTVLQRLSKLFSDKVAEAAGGPTVAVALAEATKVRNININKTELDKSE